MKSRAMIQAKGLRYASPLVFTLLLSVMVLYFWFAPQLFNNQDSVASIESLDEDETDAALQQAAENALAKREGTIIVMDPQSGRVRAAVNSRFGFEEALSPGSTIKPFAALTSLQTALINEDSRLLCRDRYVNADFEIDCSHPKISAPFDVVQALGFSCNYYFGKLGERLDADAFNATLRAYGFGAPANKGDEREAHGALPRGGRMKASNALGEGKELLVTPIQLLTAYAALANGGHLYRPRLASARKFTKEERTRITIAPAHRALLVKGMRGAVVYGTALRALLNRLPLYIFGKTGTATANDGLHTQGWFIGFASETVEARPEEIRLAVLVFIRNAHGAECAESARPVFEAFIKERNRTAIPRKEGAQAISSLPAQPQSTIVGPQVRVHLAREDRVATVAFEDYVLGVLAAEGAVEDEPEALRALAVSVRTYALQHLKRHEREGYDFCNTTHCQRYTFLESGGKGAVRDLIREARDSTVGEVLLDENGQVADSYFHAACGGMTANVETLWGSRAPKHLRGVRDEACASRPNHEWTDVIPIDRMAQALNSDSRTETGPVLKNVVVSRRDATGRAELLTLEGERRRVVRGWDLKIIVGRVLGWNVLKSSRFEVTRAGANFIFRGSGFGHGVGLCQEGAHVLAQRGTPYRRILANYFPGTSVGQRAREIVEASARARTGTQLKQPGVEWSDVGFSASGNVETWKADVLTRAVGKQDSMPAPQAFKFNAPGPVLYAAQNRRLSLTSEHFQLSYPASVSRREAEDVLRMLEATRSDVLRRASAASLNLEGLQKISVVVHPTTGDFTSATGQPFFAAGATKGRRIELQPLGLLRRRGVLSHTLRHEYAHALIDALSRGRAPRWLSEGLAIHVAGEGAMFARFQIREEVSTELLEQRLTRPASAEEMRALYATAYRRVQSLIRSEGEGSVWRRVAQM
jgi:SpoIID/LytB domain protein